MFSLHKPAIERRAQLARGNPPIAVNECRKKDGDVVRWGMILAEVTEGDMPRVVEEDVLRLEVPVDDVEAVQMFKCT